jgi:hypothetical protein
MAGKGQPKTGGRAPGTSNKVTTEFRETVRRLLEDNSENVGRWLTLVAEGDGTDGCKPDPAKALDLVAKLAEFAARTEEQTRARYVAGVDAAYQRGLTDASAKGERVAADLRAGALQLRQRWQGCEARHLPGPAAPASVADADADDRAASAGRIVRAAAECDAQVEGLQALIRADRR